MRSYFGLSSAFFILSHVARYVPSSCLEQKAKSIPPFRESRHSNGINLKFAEKLAQKVKPCCEINKVEFKKIPLLLTR